MAWNEITTLEQWQTTLAGSHTKPVLLFKHSTTCPVSANGLHEYEAFIEKAKDAGLDYVLVKVIESRPVSNQIAADLNVTHASPQIILVKDGASYWNTSHWSITVEHINAVVS
jgi:bacillithiol system protein YtxJ